MEVLEVIEPIGPEPETLGDELEALVHAPTLSNAADALSLGFTVKF